MKTAVKNGYRKSAVSANHSALSRKERAFLAGVGSALAILMGIGFLFLLDSAIEREAAFEEERLRPYIERYKANEERLRREEQMLQDLYPTR